MDRRTFLEAATTVEEALTVSDELAVIKAQIEDVKPEPISDSWRFGDAIEDAGMEALSTSQDLLEAIAWMLIVPGPYLFVVFLVVRYIKRRGIPAEQTDEAPRRD